MCSSDRALSFLNEIKSSPVAFRGVYFLSGGTDGSDGPTDAAGGFASAEILEKGNSLGLSPAAFIAESDSYSYLSRTGGLLFTGPTNTNVCDIQLVVVI